MDVPIEAPVRASAQRVIPAPLSLVWSVHTDFHGWPRWNPDVASIELHGPLAPGTVFNWKSGGSSITSKLEQVLPERRIVWTGRTMGIRAVHAWTFEETPEGVKVSTGESFDGLVASLLRMPLRKMLKTSLEGGLDYLAAECRRRKEATSS